jgi:hypothetical protein
VTETEVMSEEPGLAMSSAEISNLFRSVNERILALGTPVPGMVDLICECPNAECTQVMKMTPREHAALRVESGLRAVLPGHERVDLDEVVDRCERYLTVRGQAAGEPKVAA